MCRNCFGGWDFDFGVLIFLGGKGVRGLLCWRLAGPRTKQFDGWGPPPNESEAKGSVRETEHERHTRATHLLVELHGLDAQADEAREEGLVQAGVPGLFRLLGGPRLKVKGVGVFEVGVL